MHVDLDEHAAHEFRSTVCIVGAGIAGLALASRLADRGIDVHLLEAGGLQQEERSQAFYATEQPGDPHTGAHDGRFRVFGGSSTRWGGQLLPFTAETFSPPDGVPSAAWPIEESEVTNYYGDIETIFNTNRLSFDAALLLTLGHAPVAFSPRINLRYSKWAPFNKRNVAGTLGKTALAHPKLTVFTHANVASLEGEGAAIESARVLNYAAVEFRFHARVFIVAAGTVESSRILLSSTAVPNPHDQLGRYFQDHLSFHAAHFASPARELLLHKLGPFFIDGTLHTCKMEASPALRAQNGLGAVMAHVVVVEPDDSGAAAIRNLLRSIQTRKLKQAVTANLLPVFRGLGDVGRLVLYARFKRRRAVSARAQVILNIDLEQARDPENRIRLSDKRDALGMPVAVVDWRVNEDDKRLALRFAAIIREELAELELAPASWAECVNQGTLPVLADTYHAMGGLCMGRDPEQSVVDADLKVHALANLYVASCAVFPSGSSSNPTFTLLALTLRLADHLSAQLAGSHKAAASAEASTAVNVAVA